MTEVTPTQRVVKLLREKGVTVYTHKQWGSIAEEIYTIRKETKPTIRPATVVMQHITVTLDHGPLTGDFKRDVRTVEQIGIDRFGSGMSYNWLVDMETGDVAVGQPLDAAGTHTVNDKKVPGFPMPPRSMNYMARAIAVLGMPNTPLSRKARKSIILILVAMVQAGEVTKDFKYFPHSFFAAKDCPCDPTRDKMPGIRRAVARRLGDSKWIPRLRKWVRIK